MLQLIVNVGIDQKHPVLLGHAMKYFLQNNYKVTPKVFRDFVLFLERSKGYEEDAKRFVIMSSDTEHIQMNYQLLRPMFLRQIQYKKGQDVLKLFEQFRKNLKLNLNWKDKDANEKAAELKHIKQGIYDGLIQDLLHVEAYPLAQIIYDEKQKEKYDVSVDDQLIGMEIYALQKMLPEFSAKFKDNFTTNQHNFPLNVEYCEKMSHMLMNFDHLDHQNQRLDMIQQVETTMNMKQLFMSGSLFDSMMQVYTESQ